MRIIYHPKYPNENGLDYVFLSLKNVSKTYVTFGKVLLLIRCCKTETTCHDVFLSTIRFSFGNQFCNVPSLSNVPKMGKPLPVCCVIIDSIVNDSH